MKTITKLLALLLVLTLAFGMTACSSRKAHVQAAPDAGSQEAAPAGTNAIAPISSEPQDTEAIEPVSEDAIAGLWKYSLDFAAVVEHKSEEEIPAYLVSVFEGLTMDVYLDLQADGTFRLYLDENAGAKLSEGLQENMRTHGHEILCGALDVNDSQLEQLLTQQGITEDELIDMMLQSIDTDSLTESLSSEVKAVEGCYKYENGRIYLSDTQYFNNSKYLEVEIVGNQMTLRNIVGGDELMEDLEFLMPIVFTR